jgi:hypothetical protein
VKEEDGTEEEVDVEGVEAEAKAVVEDEDEVVVIATTVKREMNRIPRALNPRDRITTEPKRDEETKSLSFL